MYMKNHIPIRDVDMDLYQSSLFKINILWRSADYKENFACFFEARCLKRDVYNWLYICGYKKNLAIGTCMCLEGGTKNLL